ncbi:MAG: porin [Duodenibacillus massiliensis]
MWGLTGEEELGNGWKVGFPLENRYESDTGALDGDFFGSQAYLKVTNDMLTVAAGNIGALDSAGGDFHLVGGFDPLEAAFGVGGMGAFVTRDATYTNAFVLLLPRLTVSRFPPWVPSEIRTAPTNWDKNDHYYAFGCPL